MMIARLILLGWVLLAPLGLRAQPAARNQAVAVLNEYVAYCNETIHGLWPLHQAWRELNGSAVSYLSRGRGTLYFRSDDPFGEERYYEVLPAELYRRCLADSRVLGAEAQAELNQRLAAVGRVVADLQALGAEAGRYVEQGEQARDPELGRLFDLLDRAEKRFDDYDAAKERLFGEVRARYEARYGPVNPRQQIVATAAAFLPAVGVCKEMLDALDRDDTSRLEAHLLELNRLIGTYEAGREASLAGLYRFGKNNGLDAGERYDAVVGDLKDLAAHGAAFRAGREDPYREPGRRKTEYYYNERFLNKYNRYGLGLIRDFNAFADLADGRAVQREAQIPDYYINNKSIKLDVGVTRLLHWVEEPHQFRVVRPEPVRVALAGAAAGAPAAGETLEGYADNHLIFLLDVSGSMNQPERLPLLQDAFRYLLTLTRRADRVAIVSYSGEARLELKTTSAAKRGKIEACLRRLKTRGGTNANRGLALAYAVAGRGFRPAGNNRVVLASDGEFSLSPATEALIAENQRRGIVLTVFYFGPPDHVRATAQLRRLAALGRGNFQLITPANARAALLQEAQAVRKP